MAEPTFTNVVSLFPFDSDLVDDSNQNAFVTTGGSFAVSATDPKFGAGSASVGSGGYLSLKAAEFGFDFLFDATSRFTFQMWVSPTSISGTQTIFYSGGIWLGINSSGQLVLEGDNGGSVVTATSTGTFTAGAYSYVELNRDATGDWRIFLDGTLEDTQSESGNVSTAQISYIGQATGSGNDRNFVGYFDDLRLTDGETLNTTSYTAPTSAHPSGTPAISANLGGGVSILGEPSFLSIQYENISARLSVPSILSAPSFVAIRAEAVSAYLSVPSILGIPRALAENDFSAFVTYSPARYVLKISGDPVLTIPISSFQATLQTTNASFLQVVIPAYTDYATAISERKATETMTVYRALSLSGVEVETIVAKSGMDTVQMYEGPYRSTMTIQGYTDAMTGVATGKTVTLQNTRTTSQTLGGAIRARCDIDWLLRPGQTVVQGSNEFTAEYINYFVPSTGDSYMDVGDRG